MGSESDGRHDFDFLAGRWRVTNRRLNDPLLGAGTWSEFVSTVESEPILGGLGNCDTYDIPDFPGRPGFKAFALRLFDTSERTWRIWWTSTAGKGRLDTPLIGAFADGVGRFECEDVVGGRGVRVRFDWTDITPTSARWQQSFSLDGGKNFEPNWVMAFVRMPRAVPSSVQSRRH